MRNAVTVVKISSGVIVLVGIMMLILAPLVGDKVFTSLWALEPLTYIVSALIIAGLCLSVAIS